MAVTAPDHHYATLTGAALLRAHLVEHHGAQDADLPRDADALTVLHARVHEHLPQARPDALERLWRSSDRRGKVRLLDLRLAAMERRWA